MFQPVAIFPRVPVFERVHVFQHFQVFRRVQVFQRVRVFQRVQVFQRVEVFQRVPAFERHLVFFPVRASLYFIRHGGATNTGSRPTRAINPDWWLRKWPWFQQQCGHYNDAGHPSTQQ